MRLSELRGNMVVMQKLRRWWGVGQILQWHGGGDGDSNVKWGGGGSCIMRR